MDTFAKNTQKDEGVFHQEVLEVVVDTDFGLKICCKIRKILQNALFSLFLNLYSIEYFGECRKCCET